MNLKAFKWKCTVFAKKYLYYFFYKNYEYRAKGVYVKVDDYVKTHSVSVKVYCEIYPEGKSEMKLTESMLADSSSFIDYPLTTIEPPKYLLKVKNGRLLTDFLWTVAIFDNEDKLIGDVSLDLLKNDNQTIKESRILKRKYFPKCHYFEGMVFHTIGGGGTYVNYAHWLVDSLSRIHLLKESGLFDQVDWFYVPSIKNDFQIDSLKALGIPEGKIIESEKFPHIKADVILASSYSRGNYYHLPQWVVNFYMNEFPAKNIPKYRSKRYFISRKDSSYRNIVNEDELSIFLAKYNIETIVLSHLSFQEKIDLFAYADLIISLWGAGLTNLFFCKEKTVVLELFGDKLVDFTLYYDIAIKKNLDYHYLIGQNVGDVNNWKEGQNSNVFVDIDSVKEMIDTKFASPVNNEKWSVP